MSDASDNPDSPLLLRLRSDLRCSLHENDGTLYYAIEDLATGSFYRIGVDEWELARLTESGAPIDGLQGAVEWTHRSTGVYHDVYVKTAEGWRIKSRTLNWDRAD